MISMGLLTSQMIPAPSEVHNIKKDKHHRNNKRKDREFADILAYLSRERKLGVRA